VAGVAQNPLKPVAGIGAVRGAAGGAGPSPPSRIRVTGDRADPRPLIRLRTLRRLARRFPPRFIWLWGPTICPDSVLEDGHKSLALCRSVFARPSYCLRRWPPRRSSILKESVPESASGALRRRGRPPGCPGRAAQPAFGNSHRARRRSFPSERARVQNVSDRKRCNNVR